MKKLMLLNLFFISSLYSKTSHHVLKDTFKSSKNFFKGLVHAGSLYFKGANPQDYEIRNIGDSLFEDVVFNYDLNLQYITSKTNPSPSTTIYFHGWADTKNSALIWKEFFKVIDDNLICFNFPDAQFNIGVVATLDKSSFGQLSDMLPAIYALKRSVDVLDLKAINIFCVSRGCATLINALALLNDNQLFSKYLPHLSLIGIDQATRKRILNAVQKGTIILDVPLRSMKLTPFPKVIADNLTLHNKDIWDPMNMVHHLKGLKLTTLVHYQYGDKIVSNKQEAEFFSALASLNPQTTYLVMGDDGGHLHSHKSLRKALKVFDKIPCNQPFSHGESWLRLYHEKSLLIPHGDLIQFEDPSFDMVDGILKTYYNAQKH